MPERGPTVTGRERPIERLLALAGVVAVALIIVQVLMHRAAPEPRLPTTKLFEFLDDWNGWVRWHSFFGALGAMSLLAWAAAVWRFMARAGRDGPVLGACAALGMTFGYAMINIPGIILSAMAIVGTENLDPSSTRFIYTIAWNLGQVGDMGLALFMAAFSVSILQSGALPKVMGWLGVIVAVLLLTSGAGVATLHDSILIMTSVGYAGYLTWVGAASIMMYRTSDCAGRPE